MRLLWIDMIAGNIVTSHEKFNSWPLGQGVWDGGERKQERSCKCVNSKVFLFLRGGSEDEDPLREGQN